MCMQRQSSASNLQSIQKLPRLLTSKAVSEMLSVPEGTLRYWRKVGIGPKWLKLEGSIRYDLADVVAYIERGRRTPSVRANMEETRESLQARYNVPLRFRRIRSEVSWIDSEN